MKITKEFEHYIQNTSKDIVLELDGEFNITSFNYAFEQKFFQNGTKHTFQDFFYQQQRDEEEIYPTYSDLNSRAIVNFVYSKEDDTLFSSYFYRMKNGILFIASAQKEAESFLIENISTLSMEMAELTRDLTKKNEELDLAYKKIEIKTSQIESILNLQDNIVIVSNGHKLSFANQKFFDFLGYEDFAEFKKYHESISEYFIENDRFFHLGKIGEDNWLQEIQQVPHSKRIVSMLGKDFKPHAFSVSVNEFEKDLVIVSFADISQTMIEYIKMEEKTIHDKLTGAFNREFFEQNIDKLILEYNTENSFLGMALLDIDYFKSVNDNYGHDIGDEVLIHFVKTIQKFSRDEDVFIRWGGEEFILILKIHTKEDLKKALEHLRTVIEIQEFPEVGHKTCSIGGSVYQDNEDIEKTIKRADEAVYDAKAAGRNKVVIK